MNLKYRNRKTAEAVARFWNKPLDKPDWFKVQAISDDETEIMIYDVIGWPFISADDFVRALAGITAKTVTVRINSPGGDVFDGMAIFNALKTYNGKVVTRIEGIAASMASVIALAGKEVQAYANTMYMIHEPYAFTAGNQYSLRELADILEKMSGQMIDIYSSNASPGKREIAQMMKDEAWLTAKEAKEKGFIDTVIDGKGAKAQFDLSMFSNVPDGLDGGREGGELTEREIERALRDAGASRSFAKSVAVGRSTGNEGDRRDVESLKSSINAMITTFQGGK
ncbi:MAG: Clp protease ClpP [Syntrophorhabdaceae bacterium]|nr:Clp protease ClpP [Syntrophorhabdaceae bacterium]